MAKPLLSRSISYPMLLFYGLGTMVGGGFYALIGTIASTADMATPFAFLLA
jgi:amino acid transporter